MLSAEAARLTAPNIDDILDDVFSSVFSGTFTDSALVSDFGSTGFWDSLGVEAVVSETGCGAVPNIEVLFAVCRGNGLEASLLSLAGFSTTLGSTFCGTFSLDFSFSAGLVASVFTSLLVFKTSGTIGLAIGVEVFKANKFVSLSVLGLRETVLVSASGSPVSLDFGLLNIDVASLFSAKGFGSAEKAGSFGSEVNA